MRGIFHSSLHKETVELCLGKREGSEGLNGVLRRNNHKGVGKTVCFAVDCSLMLFHTFEKSRLRFWSRTVDLVRKKDIGKYRSGNEFKFRGLHIEEIDTRNIRGKQVGGKLDSLEIAADSILFGDGVKSSAEDIKTLTEHVKIGTIVDENGDEKPCVELSEGDTDFKQVITNTKTMFMDGSRVGTEIDAEGAHTDNLTVDKEIRHNSIDQTGSYVWAFRSNGNYGLSWKGV